MRPELGAVTGLALKPAVFVLALAALKAVGRSASGEGRSLLKASLLAFAAGELFCGVDVYVRRHMSLLNEGSHDLLMAAAYGLFLLGLFAHFCEKARCLNIGCGDRATCVLAADDCARGSAYGPLAGWMMIAAAATAIVPVLAPQEILKVMVPAGWGKHSFGGYMYDRTAEISFFEQKVLPALAVAAIVLAAASYFRRKKLGRFAARASALGAGALLFVYNRLVVVHVFHPDAGLTGFVEELLEATFLVLVLVGFRRHPIVRE